MYEKDNDNNTNNEDNDDCKYLDSPVIENLQINLVKEFNFKTNKETKFAIDVLRSACSLYPNDKEINTSTNYLKYNRAKETNFKLNDKLKDCTLYTIENKQISLLNIINNTVKSNLLTRSHSKRKRFCEFLNYRVFLILG